MSDLLLQESSDERRFGGLRRLYGVTGAQRIFDAHVMVVGIGGVGSWAAEALARSGVGRITLVDMDHIAESNVNRQVHALDATLGQAKVLAMRERMLAIHPQAQVAVIDDNTYKKLFAGRDAIGKVILLDNVPVRIVGVLAKIQSNFGGSDQLKAGCSRRGTSAWRKRCQSDSTSLQGGACKVSLKLFRYA